MPICLFCMQDKQVFNSISYAAAGRLIKLSNHKLRDKVSSDHYMSWELGFILNNHKCILKKQKTSYSTTIVNYASDFLYSSD